MSERPKIGLALGSGSARGLAHIGVLEVFEENGIPVDMVAGSSMGAFVGAIYATGASARMIHGIATQLCTMEYRKLFDVTIPRTGFIRGQRADAIIRTITGDRRIEDLKLPYSCVSTCLEDGISHVFKTGKVADAVRASISIPGVFEPVTIDGKTYVDGGVLDRIPAGVVRDMGADIVIAVDVGFQGGNRTTPKNIMDVLLSSYELLEWEVMRTRQASADVVITPQGLNISSSSFNQIEAFVTVGREAALAALDEIKLKLATAGVEVGA